MQISAVGIPWYEEEDYAEILRVMADGHVLPATYAEWREKAEGVERQVAASGKLCHRAVINPKTFPGWCALRGLNVDANGRSQFASEAAYKSVKSKS